VLQWVDKTVHMSIHTKKWYGIYVRKH